MLSEIWLLNYFYCNTFCIFSNELGGNVEQFRVIRFLVVARPLHFINDLVRYRHGDFSSNRRSIFVDQNYVICVIRWHTGQLPLLHTHNDGLSPRIILPISNAWPVFA